MSDLGIEVLPHPPYSPDLSPTDYHFFKHLDSFLRNKKFDDQRGVENAFEDFVEALDPQFFLQPALKNWWIVGRSESMLKEIISIKNVNFF